MADSSSSTLSIAVLVCALSLLTCGAALAAPTAPKRPRWSQPAQPYLPNCPLRYENISDAEVIEIQQVIAPLAPEALVNISGVVAGCTCEEAPGCTNQVSVVAYKPEQSKRFVLSKVEGKWQFSALETWWMRWYALQVRCNYRGLDRAEAQAMREACSADYKALYEAAPLCSDKPEWSPRIPHSSPPAVCH